MVTFSQLAFFLLKEGLQFCRDEQVIVTKFNQVFWFLILQHSN